MTPTPQEKQWLRDYLYQTMQYRETFEEVYDHVLLALEEEPEHEFFETAVMNIIDRDFGAYGLQALEENCRQAVEDMATAQFINDFKSWFITPLVIVTASLFGSLIYLELSPLKTGVALCAFFAILLILPVIICSVRGARLGYEFGETKESIKDAIFRRLAFKSNRILFFTLIISGWTQRIADYLFKLNYYLALAVTLFVAFSLMRPHIMRYLRHKNFNDSKRSEIKKLPIIPTEERLFLGWFCFVSLLIDLVGHIIVKPQSAIVHHSLSPTTTITIYSIVTAIMVLMIINVIVTIKLYRSEFKTNMVSR
ncbi:MAG TPA: hypothetical protein VNW51_05440 [Mucilaginibacter sp.]|jgi:hypothetical protein|nr:hypothetical protein [Mucilaginibacter sp.]